MGEQHFSSSTRRQHYVKAIEVYKDKLSTGDVDKYALCILLGNIAFRSYFIAPWHYFQTTHDRGNLLVGLIEYYPELTEPATELGEMKVELCIAAIEERISILEKAIKIIDQTKINLS